MSKARMEQVDGMSKVGRYFHVMLWRLDGWYCLTEGASPGSLGSVFNIASCDATFWWLW